MPFDQHRRVLSRSGCRGADRPVGFLCELRSLARALWAHRGTYPRIDARLCTGWSREPRFLTFPSRGCEWRGHGGSARPA